MQTSLDAIVLCKATRDSTGAIVDFQIVWCNERTAVITGIPQDVLLNRSMLTLDPDGHRSGIFDIYKQVVETGLPTHVNHYFAGADVWMAQSLARHDDGVLGTWADISALKRAEQAQQQETELLQAILDNTQTGVAVMQSVRDSAGRVVDFQFTHLNPDAGRITNRRREELIGVRYSEAWPEARTNGVLDWHIRVAETGEPAKINGVPLSVGAYNGWYNIRIRPFGNGVIATFVDVTALKRAELANQQQADLLRSVLDNSSNAIIAFHAVRDSMSGAITDFRYITHNEANRRNMGLTDNQIIGHTMLEFYPQMVDIGIFSRFCEVVESGEAICFEQEFPEGSWVGWYEISVRKWGDGIVLTLVNISASKGHLREIEQANRELMHANDNLRQFAYVASHDLQEPLRKIMAFSDILESQHTSRLDESGKDIIGRMKLATERMSALIKDVLAYSRISTHRESFKPVDLNELISEIEAEYQLAIQEANAQISIDALPTLQGDKAQLRQLFTNLLANALKFRPATRPLVVQIRCQTVTGGVLPNTLKSSALYHEISLIDNGIGFEDKHSDRIFQVFQRLHTRQHYQGTGVGLAICKRVVENHNGAIVATGQPNQGATFRVYLLKEKE